MVASISTRRSIPAWAGKPRQGHVWPIQRRVHPRVGGETCYGAHHSLHGCGPSPRGRGNQGAGCAPRTVSGSIPAWAGKPSSVRPKYCRVGVHPRVGGETGPAPISRMRRRGPSPRGRGNLGDAHRCEGVEGSIPAWAGKPGDSVYGSKVFGVHPRVGGETKSVLYGANRYPGPSPRGRGNRRRVQISRRIWGSIPAWAGKPPCRVVRKPPV